MITVLLVTTFLATATPLQALPTPSTAIDTSTAIDNGQGSLFFIGDSLTVGTQAFGNLESRLQRLNIWDEVVINAKVGRRTDQSLKVLSTSIPEDTTALVVALGTNDVISRRETSYPSWVINEVMEASDGLPVLWFNTEFSPTGRGDWRFRSRRFNRALRLAQAEWSNLVIADWYNYFVPKGKTRFQSDGVHLSPSAYKQRARFTESQVRQFGEQIVSATTTTTTTSTTTTTVPTTTAPSITPTAPPSTNQLPTTTTV